MAAREVAGPGLGSGPGGERGGHGVRGEIVEARARGGRQHEMPPSCAAAGVVKGTFSLPSAGRDTGRLSDHLANGTPP